MFTLSSKTKPSLKPLDVLGISPGMPRLSLEQESKTLSVRSQENEQGHELFVPERVLDGPQLVQHFRAQQKRQSVATRDGQLAVQSRWLLELVKGHDPTEYSMDAKPGTSIRGDSLHLLS